MNIRHEESSFVLYVETDEAGKLLFDLQDNILSINSVYVNEDYRNNAYALKLVTYASEYARANNLKVLPVCSYAVSVYDKGSFADLDAR